LVDLALAGGNLAVERDLVSRPYDDVRADLHLSCWNIALRAVFEPDASRRRREFHESRDCSPRATQTPCLERERQREKNETVAASNQAPMPIAPATATVISKFISGRSRLAASQALGAT
jgi:hypothetical protein